MICPKCGAEYVPGFTRCADCAVDLVDHLPEEDPVGPSLEQIAGSDLVTVLHSADVGRLGLAKSLLRSAGIRFITINEMSWYGHGPVEIRVARADAEDARQIVQDLEKDLP